MVLTYGVFGVGETLHHAARFRVDELERAVLQQDRQDLPEQVGHSTQ